jgi:phage regulator Rha-like protein
MKRRTKDHRNQKNKRKRNETIKENKKEVNHTGLGNHEHEASLWAAVSTLTTKRLAPIQALGQKDFRL